MGANQLPILALADQLERPDVAHKAYLANKAVTRLIVHGHR